MFFLNNVYATINIRRILQTRCQGGAIWSSTPSILLGQLSQPLKSPRQVLSNGDPFVAGGSVDSAEALGDPGENVGQLS